VTIADESVCRNYIMALYEFPVGCIILTFKMTQLGPKAQAPLVRFVADLLYAYNLL